MGFDVRFTYDISGVLEAEATITETAEKHRLVITGNAGVMTEQEVEQRLAELAALKIHPRDQMENRTLLARAEHMYEQLLGDARDYLGRQIVAFQAVLEKQDPVRIRPARQELETLLEQFERDSYL